MSAGEGGGRGGAGAGAAFTTTTTIPPEYTDIREKDGYRYYAFIEGKDRTGDSAWWTFQDEEGVRQTFYYPYLQPKMHVLDVGAGYGSYTLPALQRGCCDVTVITPQVAINNEHIKLRCNIELNNFQDRCTIIDSAVYSQHGYINPNTRHFAKYEALKEKETKDEYVKCAPIDDLMRNRPKVDFIKMDVEAAEYEALRGAANIIRRDKPIMLIENHLCYEPGIEKKVLKLVLGEWKDLGYMASVQPYASISHTLFTIKKKKKMKQK